MEAKVAAKVVGKVVGKVEPRSKKSLIVVFG